LFGLDLYLLVLERGIGGTGLLAIAAWGISQGRLPTTNQMVGDIDVA